MLFCCLWNCDFPWVKSLHNFSWTLIFWVKTGLSESIRLTQFTGANSKFHTGLLNLFEIQYWAKWGFQNWIKLLNGFLECHVAMGSGTGGTSVWQMGFPEFTVAKWVSPCRHEIPKTTNKKIWYPRTTGAHVFGPCGCWWFTPIFTPIWMLGNHVLLAH